MPSVSSSALASASLLFVLDHHPPNEPAGSVVSLGHDFPSEPSPSHPRLTSPCSDTPLQGVSGPCFLVANVPFDIFPLQFCLRAKPVILPLPLLQNWTPDKIPLLQGDRLELVIFSDARISPPDLNHRGQWLAPHFAVSSETSEE